ncbi:hypothetical protein CDAR_192191 [Caerostris darwini]|uniref:Uncharacterized protein n=1 Tax=Caerostris darwini TaxID=1538125 RepID=A0AAV4PES4_9ARAC|nr:hypothetical protein CDAR_192191 [Caerostris darwini]
MVSNKENLWSENIQGVHNETMNRSPLKALVGQEETPGFIISGEWQQCVKSAKEYNCPPFRVLCDILCDTLSHRASNKECLWSEIIQGVHNETMIQSPLKALVRQNETPGFTISGEWHQCVKSNAVK